MRDTNVFLVRRKNNVSRRMDLPEIYRNTNRSIETNIFVREIFRGASCLLLLRTIARVLGTFFFGGNDDDDDGTFQILFVTFNCVDRNMCTRTANLGGEGTYVHRCTRLFSSEFR